MRSALRYAFFGWVDGWQSEQIEQLQQSTLATDIELLGDLAALRREVVAQSVQLEELATIVTVMSRMLADAGQLDSQVLARRVEAALEERREPPPGRSAKCVLCGVERPAGTYSTTPYGAACHPSCVTAGSRAS
jgi:hypothetical protein